MFKYIRDHSFSLTIYLSLILFPVLTPAKGSTEPIPLHTLIDKRIKEMSIEEKAGQLFIVGFPNKKIDENVMEFIRTYKPGSFILFKRNIESLRQIKILTSDLYRLSYSYNKLPPLIAIDQEGGIVSRLPIFPAPPSALALGQTGSPEIAEEMGLQTGMFLRASGFNMNLAPVLDISDPFIPSFIADRSFGSDAEQVKDFGLSFSKGLLNSHVIPTAKHFPGGGNLIADPHSEVVKNYSSLEQLSSNDLVPFKAYSTIGPTSAIMISHTVFPKIDASANPAVLSREISTSLLRDKLGFQGLAITDDLLMTGSKKNHKVEEAAIQSLKAGADLIMITWSNIDQIKTIKAVKTAIKNGLISAEELHKKLHRILFAKAFTNSYHTQPLLEENKFPEILSSTNYKTLNKKILDTNFKKALGDTRTPSSSKEPRSLATLQPTCAVLDSMDFYLHFKSFIREKCTMFFLNKGSVQSNIEDFFTKEKCGVLLLTVHGKRSANIYNALPLSIKEKSVIINLSTPFVVSKREDYRKVYDFYYDYLGSAEKIASHLSELINKPQELEIRN